MTRSPSRPGNRPTDGQLPEGLRRFLAPREPVGSRCEMCATPIADEHSHVVDTGNRALLCTCLSCSLLFTSSGAAGGRYRTVPRRYRHEDSFRLDAAQWEALGIPVGMAYFFRNSSLDRVVALYPSPAGATECELSLDAWDDIVAANPALGEVEPDVEAVLVRRTDDAGFTCYVVPIDACYALVGIVRTHWRGFDGGAQVRRHVDAFFADVQSRCRPRREGR